MRKRAVTVQCGLGPEVFLMGLDPRGTSGPPGGTTITTQCARPPSLLASCGLLADCPPPPPPLPAVVVLLLLPERGERLADFVPEWEPSSVAEPMWPGAGAGWEEALLPKPELHQTPINHLPKYSILDLPLVMFKLNILSFSLQAQLPPGMPSFRDYS